MEGNAPLVSPPSTIRSTNPKKESLIISGFAISFSPEILALVAVMGKAVSFSNSLTQESAGRRTPIESPSPSRPVGNVEEAFKIKVSCPGQNSPAIFQKRDGMSYAMSRTILISEIIIEIGFDGSLLFR